MFQPNTTDLQYIFESAGQEVLINDIEQQAIITNPSISEYEERYIHTLGKAKRGDIITYQGERYLIISESVTKRGGKYKALMRHCNVVLEIQGDITMEIWRDENGEIVYDDFGQPIFYEVEGEPYLIPSIIDNKSFSIDGEQFTVPNNQIVVIVQDNETNRQKFTLNFEFQFEGNFKVLNRDFTKRGLIILTCEKVTG
jgi:hypothetical protein